jgi:SET domain-containing protein
MLTKEESEKRADVHLEAHSSNKEEKGAVYIFTLNDEYDVDGDVSYNTAKYINHSCNPNCETDVIDDHIWVLSSRDIKKGEELTYNYGYDLDMYEDHPCKCGSENCIGYIVAEEHWPEVKRQKEEKLKETDKHKQ